MSTSPEPSFPVWKKAGLALAVWAAGGWMLRAWLGDWAYLLMLAALLVLIFSSLNSRLLWLWEILATLTLLALVAEF